jgi:hypothetical protein
MAVGGLLFGFYASDVRYGILTCGVDGLPTYGDVHCRMKDVAVNDRVSFLETNSYRFVELYGVRPGQPLPVGHRAVWDNRHLLAVAKLHAEVAPNQMESSLKSLLVRTDGVNRSGDEFIEAIIFGPFNVDALERMEVDDSLSPGSDNYIDAAIARKRFEERKSG